MNKREPYYVKSLGTFTIPGERENPKNSQKEVTSKLTVN